MNAKGNYKALLQNYLRQEKIYNTRSEEIETKKKMIRKRIDKLQIQISNLDKKQAAIIYPHWTEYIVRPIMEEIVRLTPEIQWEEREQLHVFGLRAECPIFGTTACGRTIGITFTFDHSDLKLYYDTGEEKKRYYSDTIGDLNGFNHVQGIVESMETVLSFINQQTTPLGNEYDFITDGVAVQCTAKEIAGEYTIKRVVREKDGNIYDDTPIIITINDKEFFVYPKELQRIQQ